METIGSGLPSGWNIVITNLHFALPDNPSLSGVDLSTFTSCRISDVFINESNPNIQPTAAYAFGIRLPDTGNSKSVYADHLTVIGVYTGIVCHSSQTHIRHAIVNKCILGIGIQPKGTSGPKSHASLFEYLGTEHCWLHISGWAPNASLVTTIPAPANLIIPVWDIEDADSGWSQTGFHLFDPLRMLNGRANHVRVRQNLGLVPGPLVTTTTPKFALEEIS
ncbi:MAG: hypothetical protein IPK93_04595 [Solirubrobacterales bacterium]|nr:hypothetical protein [Solirubrobacterales bacterium]